MKKILLTGIGGDIAQSVASIIIEYYSEIKIIGTDIHLMHAGKLYTSKIYKVPGTNSNSYLRKIKEIIKKEKIDYCLPTNEKEILKLSANSKYFSKVKFIILKKKSYQRFLINI